MAETKRRSARVILLDRDNRVLLIRFSVQRDGKPFAFWATPGGAIEAGETDIEAARRELIEELHIDVSLTGPVHTSISQFKHEGAPVANADVFFMGRCNEKTLKLDGVTASEKAAMKEIKWWPIAEIEQTTETIFPSDLVALIRAKILAV